MWNDNREFDSMIYLLYCALNDAAPDASRLEGIDGGKFAALCKQQQLSALVYMAAEKLDAAVFGEKGAERLRSNALQAIRVNVLFEMERMQVFGALQRENIPYMPLKGCVLKQYYPEAKRREMGDVDVLIDAENAERIRELMISLGYACEDFGETHHDEYFKEPFYTFEMHRSLSHHFGDTWDHYYENIREKLLPSGDGSCELRFTDEDFYLYLVAHEYKHYCFSGTGLRSLLDIYVYLNHKTLDLEYVAQEARKMGCAEYERINRELALALFGDGELTAEGEEMLTYIVSSGTYGTNKQRVQNKMKRKGWGKSRYVLNRFFVPVSRKNEAYDAFSRQYPTFYKHKILLPFLPFYRTARAIRGGRFGGELKSIRAAGADGVKPDEGGEKNAKKND